MPYPPLRTAKPGALAVVAAAGRLAVPVIVLGEYPLGIAQSRHRADYENWQAGADRCFVRSASETGPRANVL
jgi:predicted nucleic acid-binding protein